MKHGEKRPNGNTEYDISYTPFNQEENMTTDATLHTNSSQQVTPPAHVTHHPEQLFPLEQSHQQHVDSVDPESFLRPLNQNADLSTDYWTTVYPPPARNVISGRKSAPSFEVEDLPSLQKCYGIFNSRTYPEWTEDEGGVGGNSDSRNSSYCVGDYRGGSVSREDEELRRSNEGGSRYKS